MRKTIISLIVVGLSPILIASAALADQETTVSGTITVNTDSGKVTWGAGASQSNTNSSPQGSSTNKIEIQTTDSGKTVTGTASHSEQHN
jgi:hypothetical protein